MINQQINLYLAEFRVKKDPLTAVLMAQILGGVVGLMLLISLYDVTHRWLLNSELAGLNETLIEETRKTVELDAVLAQRSQNTELTERLQAAESRLDSRQQIHDFLNNTTLGNIDGFSEYFKDLSRASIEGLRISTFAFANGGESVSMSGQVVDSAMVPRFVANLEKGSSSLRAKHFSPSISRSDIATQYFSFSLSSSNE